MIHEHKQIEKHNAVYLKRLVKAQERQAKATERQTELLQELATYQSLRTCMQIQKYNESSHGDYIKHLPCSSLYSEYEKIMKKNNNHS